MYLRLTVNQSLQRVKENHKVIPLTKTKCKLYNPEDTISL